MYGYGLFNFSTTSGDSLVLFFGATAIGLSPALVGLLDAANSLTFAIGAVALVFILPHLARINVFFVLSLWGFGLVLVLHAVVGSPTAILALALPYGLLQAPSSVLAPVVATNTLPPGVARSEAFGNLHRVSSLGGAAGLGVAVLWLTIAGPLGTLGFDMRLLFLGIGLVAVLGGLYIRGCLRNTILRSETSPRAEEPRRNARNGAARPRSGPARLPVLSDQLVYYLLFSFVLFVGLGMSFTGIHIFLVQDLRTSAALAMGAVLGFRLASFLVSRPSGQGVASYLPLQVQVLASLGRGMAVAAVALIGLLPTGLALPMVMLLVTLWGFSGGAVGVTGAEVTARLAVAGRLKESMALYMAVANAGSITGAWLGGLAAGTIGFESMFLVSAALIVLAAILLLRS